MTGFGRREVALGSGLAALSLGLAACIPLHLRGRATPAIDIERIERSRVLANGARWLPEQPQTITKFPAPRSPGDIHAYYSEGDYWWPDPDDAAAPYIRRDGQSNPDRFDAHRQALIRLSLAVPSLTAAWMLTGQRSYADAAARHLRAWFVDSGTRMAPHLDHAQAIIGQNSGRGIGVIDTLQLVEVALAIGRLPLDDTERKAIEHWFAVYLDWMWTSPNGVDERDETNNHGSCYALQVAAFAGLTGDEPRRKWCRRTLVETLIETQIAPDGRQPLELARTKPYGYCLFNLDVLAGLAHLLDPGGTALWLAKGARGGSLADALAYMVPFIADKGTWPHTRDIAYWTDWPVRQPALLIGGAALHRENDLSLWRSLDPDPRTPEIIRNFPLRQPLLWWPKPLVK